MKQYSEIQTAIGNINLKLATLNSGIRKTTEGTKSASKALDEYISKLEKFLNLLKRILCRENHISVWKYFVWELKFLTQINTDVKQDS